MSRTQGRRPYLDRCPECLDTLNQPKKTTVTGDSARCTYRCPKCLYSWFTGWRVREEPVEVEDHNDAA